VPTLPAHRVDWSLTALLTLQAVTLFAAIPLGLQYPTAHIVLDICRLLFAVVCIVALTRHRVLQAVLAISLVALLVGPFIGRSFLLDLGIDTRGEFHHALIEAIAFGFNAVITALVARHVFSPGRVNAHRVQGAILLYLNIAALFGIAYSAIATYAPDAITLANGTPLSLVPGQRTAALTYFSLVTITTTGFGDVVPVHPLARSLVNLEAVIGQLFPATLLARIVALNIEHGRRDNDRDEL
jgi:hypothetical protein